MMYRDLLAKELDLQGAEMEALGYLAQAYVTIILCQFIDSLMVHSYPAMLSQSSAQLLITGGVGRPVFEIPRGQLQYLFESRFSVPQIAQLLGVSISTVRRRMSSYNLSVRSTYSPMTDSKSTLADSQLHELVATVQQQFPNWGNQQMYGHLLSRGIRVPFCRITKQS